MYRLTPNYTSKMQALAARSAAPLRQAVRAPLRQQTRKFGGGGDVRTYVCLLSVLRPFFSDPPGGWNGRTWDARTGEGLGRIVLPRSAERRRRVDKDARAHGREGWGAVAREKARGCLGADLMPLFGHSVATLIGRTHARRGSAGSGGCGAEALR